MKKISKKGQLLIVTSLIVLMLLAIVTVIIQASKDVRITAYAKGEDGRVSSSYLSKWRKVPVTEFKTSEGVAGFVFSYDVDSFGSGTKPINIAIVNDNTMVSTKNVNIRALNYVIDEINGVENSNSKHYFFYIPSANENSPYSFDCEIDDSESKSIISLVITIKDVDGSFYAFLESGSFYKAPDNLDELLEPYQQVIDKLNSDYGYNLIFPDEDKYRIYYAYRDMSPEEFEKSILDDVMAEGGENVSGQSLIYYPIQ